MLRTLNMFVVGLTISVTATAFAGPLRPIAELQVGALSAFHNPRTDILYVADVDPFDCAECGLIAYNMRTGERETLFYPSGGSFLHNSAAKAVIVHAGSSVWSIDLETHQVTSLSTFGLSPRSWAIDREANRIYLAGSESGDESSPFLVESLHGS